MSHLLAGGIKKDIIQVKSSDHTLAIAWEAQSPNSDITFSKKSAMLRTFLKGKSLSTAKMQRKVLSPLLK